MYFPRFVLSGFTTIARRFAREPAFSVIFVITLALGVGANAALFSALRGYFLVPLPYNKAWQLIEVSQKIVGNTAISAATYGYLRRNAHSLSAAGVSRETDGILVVGSGQAQKVRMNLVTASWFKTLGVAPFLGHTFGPNSDKPGGPKEVVLSYRFWQNVMHGDPHVVGKTIRLDSSPYVVVGVMPSGFHFASQRVKFWVPLTINPATLRPSETFTLHDWHFVARLQPGMSRAAANRELNALAMRQVKLMSSAAQKFIAKHKYRIVTKPLREALMGSVGKQLLLIELGAALLLLLTAAILANLITVRTLARRHEAALRITLGASRFDLWRAALAETLPLGLIGGALAVGLAWWGTTLIARYGIGAADTAFSIKPDVWIVAFSLALGVTVGAVAALPAAFASRKRLLARLSEGGRGSVGQRARLTQRGLSVTQVALGVALMINAALLGLAFKQVSSHPIGVNTRHLTVADLALHGPRFNDQAARLGFYRTLGDAVRKLPGVERAGVASSLPFTGGINIYSLRKQGAPRTDSVTSILEFVDGHALAAMRPQLLHGRLIDADDVHSKANVAVIDARLAQALFGTSDAVGREVLDKDQPYRVVGVIAPILWTLGAQDRFDGIMWLPYSIAPQNKDFETGPGMDIAIRSTLTSPTLKRELESLLHRLAPDQAFSFVESMHDLKQDAYHEDKALPVLFGLFSLIALILAAVGTYGTVAYLIRQRLGEFAVRQALGATPTRIGVLALTQGALIAALGIGIGIGGGFLLARALSGLIHGAGSTNALAYLAAAIVMALAALLATAIPARRARRADLTTLLRPQ